ncbi:MAG: hypothetical protein HY512_01165 [Candidatus Aenigmarchaeota archaeon]|nr:hypothetical protein [Candidatus Aenigmarchaeota archaeon]
MKLELVVGVIAILIAVVLVLPTLQPTAEIIVKQPEPVDFKLATMAVCQEKDGQNFCEDKIFYKCGEEVKQVSGPVVCNGQTFNLDLDKLGKGTFNSNWTDPRDAGFVGDWIAKK